MIYHPTQVHIIFTFKVCMKSSWFSEGGGAALGGLRSHAQLPGINGDTLGAVVSFVYTHQSVGQFKHVVAQADNDELSILGALLRREEGMEGGRSEERV